MSEESRQKQCASLSKNTWKLWQHEYWCIPNIDASFVAILEDVLNVSAQPSDPDASLVCFDEKLLVVYGGVREPLPAKPRVPQCSGDEYERLRTANVCVSVKPLAGRRCVGMTNRLTTLDVAQTIHYIVNEVSPEARIIRLVVDNLTTSAVSSLYEAFPPEQAQRIWKQLVVHSTPKYGTWLTLAEIEVSMLERGRLSKRVTRFDHLRQHIEALARERNARGCQIHWHFPCANALAQTHSVYPLQKSKED
jgi:hypothetical protein